MKTIPVYSQQKYRNSQHCPNLKKAGGNLFFLTGLDY